MTEGRRDRELLRTHVSLGHMRNEQTVCKTFGLLRQQEILLSRQIDTNFPATTPLKFWELVNTSNLFPGQKEHHVQLFGTPELSSQHVLHTYYFRVLPGTGMLAEVSGREI